MHDGFDLLPELEGDYVVPQHAIEVFRRDGHVKLSGVLRPAEIAAYRPLIIEAIEARVRLEQAEPSGRSAVGAGWIFVKNVWELSHTTRRFVLSRRLGRVAADLLGVEAVRVFRDQSYFKEPGGDPTPWHQDSRFIPIATDQIVALWVPLTRVTADMAPLSYVNGSHKSPILDVSGSTDAQMESFERDLRARGHTIDSPGAVDLGDVSVHYAGTLHSSPRNVSASRREVLVIAYFPDGARVAFEPPLAPDAGSMDVYSVHIRKQNSAMALPGIEPGDIAAGPHVPLVYCRQVVARQGT